MELGQYAIPAIYTVCGPLAWLVIGFALLKSRARLRIRLSPPRAPDGPLPAVSVIVPCRNESTHIASCLRSILDQNYAGDLQVIAIDDRSTDNTASVIDALRDDSAGRLQTLHVREGELPDGWLGKPNALTRGVAIARGQWLVFVDSDCTLAPNAVIEAIATGVGRRFDLVSFIPRFVGSGFWDGLMTPLCGIATSAMFGIMYANSAMLPRIAFACGQFIAIRREVYDAIGGHAAVKDSAGEDVEIARILKRRGYRPRLGWGLDLITTRMYSDLRSIMQGWSRNFIAASRGRPWRVLAAVSFLFAGVFSAIPALVLGDHLLQSLGVSHLVLITMLLALGYHQAAASAWRALLWPISIVVLLAIYARSLLLCYTRRLTWRGSPVEVRAAS